MQDFLVTALMFIGLAHLICGRVWFWSRTIPHPRLGPVLRWSALAWSGLLTAIFLAALFATSTCDGSLLSGLGPCRAPMLKTRIIPCLDVADGRVVKGVNFVDLRDAGDPVEQAQAYDAAGADELCFLDIHATHENRGTMYDLATRTAEHCFMPLTIGGGVRTVEDVRNLLLAGADKVSFNSAAVADPDVIARAADKFGSQCIVCAIDAKTVAPGQMGDLHPWRAANPPASTRWNSRRP
jgi:hypothetical protein